MEWTHFDQDGNAVMVDVSNKDVTVRQATASGIITLGEEAYDAVLQKKVKKGDVLNVARVAGIMAVKKTADFIPMCHPLSVSACTVDFHMDEEQKAIEAVCKVKITGQTGVEMEALTGVSVTLLTIYDMCKALNKDMVISKIQLQEKQGGKSGHYVRQP